MIKENQVKNLKDIDFKIKSIPVRLSIKKCQERHYKSLQHFCNLNFLLRNRSKRWNLKENQVKNLKDIDFKMQS
jgi:hypothetical protein